MHLICPKAPVDGLLEVMRQFLEQPQLFLHSLYFLISLMVGCLSSLCCPQLVCPGCLSPSTRRASAFPPFWQRFPLTTSQLCHAEAASTGQLIYQKDMENSLRSAVASTLPGAGSCGKGSDANLVSHPCCRSIGGHGWERGGWCGHSMGLPAWLSCLLVSYLP